VDVSGLMAFPTEKEEPEPPRPQYFWHVGILIERKGSIKAEGVPRQALHAGSP